MELPKFTYFPDPIKVGSIEASEKSCECCGEKRGYIYKGTMYCRDNVEALCPWCIHNGSAAEKFDGAFNNFGSEEDEVDEPCELAENVAVEISCRTPGFATFQEEDWQMHCSHVKQLPSFGIRKQKAHLTVS